MDFNPISRAVAVLPVAGRQLATLTGTNTSHPTTSTTSGAPPGRHEKGPAAGGADRAWGITENNHGTPVLQAGVTSVAQVGADAVPGFPASKAEATQAARLAIAGWALQRASLADGGSGYIATRWGRDSAVMATLDAVVQFADRVGAPS